MIAEVKDLIRFTWQFSGSACLFYPAIPNKKTTAGNFPTLVNLGNQYTCLVKQKGGNGYLPIKQVLIRMKPIVRQPLV
jgi:hypothetical protein